MASIRFLVIVFSLFLELRSNKEELSMIEELDPIEEELAEPVKKASKKKKQKVTEPADKQNNVM